jgi:ApbE superfamily uncharacterized protein (UPF0280 family)
VDWLSPDGLAEAMATDLANRVSSGPPAVVKMTKQAVNAYANAMNHVASFMDLDQALVCDESPDAINARKAFSG